MLRSKNIGKTTIKSPHPPFTKGGQEGIFGGEEGFSEQNQKAWRSLWSVVCCLLSISILAGCATTEDVGRMQWEINELKGEVKNIKQKSKVLESQIPGQEEQFNKRLKALEEEQKATSSAVSDLLIKMQTLTGELQVMTGRLDEMRYFSEKSLKELTESKDALIARVKELEIAVNELKGKHARLESVMPPAEEQKPSEDIKKPEEKSGESEKTEKEEKVPGREMKDVYMEAYQAYKVNQLEEAREKFQALLRDYPENEYSDNARFWIGESYYKEKNYEDAVLAYEELLKKSPQSDKVPGAMLKQGFAFYEMNDQKTGRIILEKLIEKFPDSKEATLAKKKISPTKRVESRK